MKLEEFLDHRQVEYSILSHCWTQSRSDPEVTYQDFITGTNIGGQGWEKIRHLCEISRERGFTWTWIDTCCIDKLSSAELTEAINSMWKWYQGAGECYVFLDDCNLTLPLPRVCRRQFRSDWRSREPGEDVSRVDQFLRCRWFTRGWTLQELLAPRKVLFFNDCHRLLGTKSQLAPLVSLAAGVSMLSLENYEYQHPKPSVAQRMAWAARRLTTREEDRAYCLFGLFDVSMPLLYGEGSNAFRRLQEEIIRKFDDLSILAWGQDDLYSEPESDHDLEIEFQIDDPDKRKTALGEMLDHELKESRRNGIGQPKSVTTWLANRMRGTHSILARDPSDFLGSELVTPIVSHDSDISKYSLTNRGLEITTYEGRKGVAREGSIELQLSKPSQLNLVLQQEGGLWYRKGLRDRSYDASLPSSVAEEKPQWLTKMMQDDGHEVSVSDTPEESPDVPTACTRYLACQEPPDAATYNLESRLNALRRHVYSRRGPIFNLYQAFRTNALRRARDDPHVAGMDLEQRLDRIRARQKRLDRVFHIQLSVAGGTPSSERAVLEQILDLEYRFSDLRKGRPSSAYVSNKDEDDMFDEAAPEVSDYADRDSESEDIEAMLENMRARLEALKR